MTAAHIHDTQAMFDRQRIDLCQPVLCSEGHGDACLGKSNYPPFYSGIEAAFIFNLDEQPEGSAIELLPFRTTRVAEPDLEMAA